jgi:hypothetical protein
MAKKKKPKHLGAIQDYILCVKCAFVGVMNEKFNNIIMHGIKCPNNRRGVESATRVEYRRRKTDCGKIPLNNTHGYTDRPTQT